MLLPVTKRRFPFSVALLFGIIGGVTTLGLCGPGRGQEADGETTRTVLRPVRDRTGAYRSSSSDSSFEGTIWLAGRRWKVMYKDAANPKVSPASDMWRMRIDLLESPAAVQAGPLLFCPKTIAVGPQAYAMKYRPTRTEGGIGIEVTATPQPWATGTLHIAGHFVRSLVLTGKDAVVILVRPSENTAVPRGTYNLCEVSVCNPRVIAESGENTPFSYYTRFGTRLEIREGETTRLLVGGPLFNKTYATRSRDSIRISCRPVGQDGRVYATLASEGVSQYAVVQNDRTLSTGTMEYG